MPQHCIDGGILIHNYSVGRSEVGTCSVREYVGLFYVFFRFHRSMTFYVFFEMTYQKVVKSHKK